MLFLFSIWTAAHFYRIHHCHLSFITPVSDAMLRGENLTLRIIHSSLNRMLKMMNKLHCHQTHPLVLIFTERCSDDWK